MLRIGGGIDRVDTSFYPGHCIHERGLIAPDRVIIVEKLDRCLEHRSYVVLFCVHWDLSSLVFVFGSGEIPPSPTLAFSLDVRGAFRATSGIVLAAAGQLFTREKALLPRSNRRKPLTNSKPAAPLYLSEDWFELTVSFPQLVPESEDRCGFDPRSDRVAASQE